MEIMGILKELELELVEQKTLLDEQETKLAECERIAEEALAAVDAVTKMRNCIKERYEALAKAKEALSGIDIPTEIKEIEEKTTEKVEKTGKTKRIKQIQWTRKNGTLVRYDRNGKEMQKFVSQKAAARELGWDQSSMSIFVRLKPEEQIRRKGFYFRWIP